MIQPLSWWERRAAGVAAAALTCLVLLMFLRNDRRAAARQEVPEHRPTVTHETVVPNTFPVHRSVTGLLRAESAGTITVHGHVLDPEGKPASGVVVTLSKPRPRHASARPRTTTTDRDGAYWFDGQEPGSAVVLVHLDPASEFVAPPPRSLELESGAKFRNVDIRLTRGLSIVGFVRSSTSEPIEHAFVRAKVLRDGPQSERTTSDPAALFMHLPSDRPLPAEETPEREYAADTDSSGYFLLSGMTPRANAVVIQAGASGFGTTYTLPRFPFEEAQEITLEKLSQVTIIANDAVTSAPIRRFRYRLTSQKLVPKRPGILEWTEPSIWEKPGHAHVGGVPPGEWHIAVEELNDLGAPTGRCADTPATLAGGVEVVHVCLGTTRSLEGAGR